MKHLDIDNPENKKSIQEILKAGANSDFWKIICQRLQKAIDGVQVTLDSDAFDNLIAEEFKIRTQVLRKEKSNLTGILDLPETMVNELEKPEFFDRQKENEVYLEPDEIK